MKITVGITTYNRKCYLERLQRSLHQTEDLGECAVRIYDDVSSQINITDLRQLFPKAANIFRRPSKLGADRNMHQMFVDFLATGDDVLVVMDADMICRADWLHFIKKYFPHTDGIMTLYNSICHLAFREVAINGHIFWEKLSIGAAGVVLQRDLIRQIVNDLPPSDGYDWAWSALLRQSGRMILSVKESYFQHIGLLGLHSNGFDVEYGLYFDPGHDVNKEIMCEYQREVLTAKNQYIQKLILDFENRNIKE